jgi:hypothetical protein
VLVRREADGSCAPVGIGQTREDAASLNLAHIRHFGARSGANEVHVHLLASSQDARDAAERDLAAGQRGRVRVSAPEAQRRAA